MPELIGDRITKQINANGDERIDHDEFVQFFMKLLMGTFEQKMLIAFRCYDVDNDENISDEEIRIVLKHIPIQVEQRYGISFADVNYDFSGSHTMTRVEYLNHKRDDNE